MIGQAQRNNPTSSTEVVGSILDQSSCSDGEGAEQTQSDYVALCTLDGMEHVLVEHLSLSLSSVFFSPHLRSLLYHVLHLFIFILPSTSIKTGTVFEACLFPGGMYVPVYGCGQT